MIHDLSIKYSRKWSKAGPPLSPMRRKPVDACQVHWTEREEAMIEKGNQKITLGSMRICNNSMEEVHGVKIVCATAP